MTDQQRSEMFSEINSVIFATLNQACQILRIWTSQTCFTFLRGNIMEKRREWWSLSLFLFLQNDFYRSWMISSHLFFAAFESWSPNPLPYDKFWTLPISKTLQTTILNLMKIPERSPNRLKTLWEKGKLLVTSNFSFSHSVFKRLVMQTRKKPGLVSEKANTLQYDKILDLSKFKEFGDDKIIVVQNLKFVLEE